MGTGRHGDNSYSGYQKFKQLPWSEAMKFRRQFGQDAYDEDIYVGTSDSFSINAWLRQQVGQQASGWVVLDEQDIKDRVKEIDTWMRPSPVDFAAVRFVGNDWLRDNFGTDKLTVVKDLINKNKVAIHDAGFCSMSLDIRKNVFTGRSAVLHLNVPKGTPLFFTSNSWESEVLGNRNFTFELRKSKIVGGQLHIEVMVKHKSK